ncbi:hypothetical protein AWY96_10265 [Serratia plymuthica]|nr:hypothetical protein AWY96_10265 [Serratia plymuthica]
MLIFFLTLIAVPTVGFCASYIGMAKVINASIGGYTWGFTLDYSWPTAETPDQILPCYRTECFLGISTTIITPEHPDRAYSPQRAHTVVSYYKNELLSAVRARWIARFGASGNITEPGWTQSTDTPYLDSALACLQYWPYNTPYGSVGDNVPQSTCLSLTPPDVMCDSLPPLLFEFGTVASGRTSGLRLTQRQTLRCTNATSVTFRLVNDLKLTRTLTAHASVNGLSLDTNGVTLPVGRHTVPLDFVVTTTGDESDGGTYTASSVLIMEYK